MSSDGPYVLMSGSYHRCQVYQSYGKTASSGVGLSTTFGDYAFPFGEHVGVPLPSVEVKLVDVAMGQYTATDKPNPRGEVNVQAK